MKKEQQNIQEQEQKHGKKDIEEKSQELNEQELNDLIKRKSNLCELFKQITSESMRFSYSEKISHAEDIIVGLEEIQKDFSKFDQEKKSKNEYNEIQKNIEEYCVELKNMKKIQEQQNLISQMSVCFQNQDYLMQNRQDPQRNLFFDEESNFNDFIKNKHKMSILHETLRANNLLTKEIAGQYQSKMSRMLSMENEIKEKKLKEEQQKNVKKNVIYRR
jgi:hypothetical protein